MARKGISLRGLRRLMGTVRELCDGGRFGDGVTFDSLTMTQIVNGCADTCCGNVDMSMPCVHLGVRKEVRLTVSCITYCTFSYPLQLGQGQTGVRRRLPGGL